MDDYLVIGGTAVIELGRNANKKNWMNLSKKVPGINFERIPTKDIIARIVQALLGREDYGKSLTPTKGGGRHLNWKY